jgi:hypothetical protein
MMILEEISPKQVAALRNKMAVVGSIFVTFGKKEAIMLGKTLSTFAVVSLIGVIMAGSSCAQAAPANLSGTYRCKPEPSSCQWSGQRFTVVQSGDKLDLKNDKGEVAQGTVTSNISLSVGGPWNMLGVVLPDNEIQWSNGTEWQKQ